MKQELKIAYLIVAYTDPEELGTLVKRLAQSADVYIHINKSVDIDPFKKAVEGIKGRVCFSTKRYQVVWGGYSILQATFCILEQALNTSSYDRVVLLTGLDYPIKSDQYIQKFFSNHLNTEFVYANVITGKIQNTLYYFENRDNRFFHKFFGIMNNCLKKMHCKGRHDYITIEGKNLPIYGKAPKWAITGECAKYLLNFYKTNKKMNQYFMLTHAPDDYYVATVLFHSPFKENIDYKSNIFKIVWLPNDRGAKVLTEEDNIELIECDQLYAKKFQSNASEKLQSILEEESRKEVNEVGT